MCINNAYDFIVVILLIMAVACAIISVTRGKMLKKAKQGRLRVFPI